jgi:hypothetical protein
MQQPPPGPSTLPASPARITSEDRGYESAPIPQEADWLVYLGIIFCALINALIGAYKVEADTVAYLDLSDAVKDHIWHATFNASWFPLYPALVAIAKSLFSYRPQYELMAARLVDFALGLFFVLAAVALAVAVRHLMLARGIKAVSLLPSRILYLWVATLAYFFLSQDLTGIKPDALVSALMILAVAALIWAITQDKDAGYAAAGIFGALAFWTKAFAFPFFILWIFLVAAVNLRKPRILARLFMSLCVFTLIAGPYILHISRDKGRITIGDSGRLNTAWYVNGADRFNPITDFSSYQPGDAQANFKHPGRLLSKSPEISYYGDDQVYGSTPQWDDFSYWSDGLAPRFVLRQTANAFKRNLIAFSLILPMRLQAVILLATLYCWGFTVRASSLPDPILMMAFLLALASLLSFMLVHFEARYIAFVFVLAGTLYAACSVSVQTSANHRSLHAAVLLIAGLLLLFGLQASLREYKQAQAEGAHPLKGIYSMALFSAGTSLASLYPQGTEVACMGDAACWADPVWAKYARLKMTAIVETGNGAETKAAKEGCVKLQQNPVGLNLLRQRHVRAIVSNFEGTMPCSPNWLPLGTSGNYFYLPL